MPLHKAPESQDVNKPAPKTKEDLKRQVEVSQKMAELDLKTKLSPGNLQRFLVNHSADKYRGYREWNKNFCKSVLGLEKVGEPEQKLRVKALQNFLNKEVGGFTDKPGKIDSIDGMLGRHTLGRLDAYYKKIVPLTPKAEKREAVAGSKERFKPENTFYAGDSYMAGILRGQNIKNRRAVASSHLVRTKRFDTNYYRKQKKLIFVEEEAMRFINNPECRLLVLNGGVNDLYSRGASRKTANEIMNSYKKIIEAAHKKGIKVTVYSLNTRRELPRQSDRMKKTIARANNLTAEINSWLQNKSGADRVINTDDVLSGRLSGDGLHATSSGYRDLFNTINKYS